MRLKRKFAVNDLQELEEKAQSFFNLLDDYEYQIYSGGLAKDHVKKLIKSLKTQPILSAG